MWKDYNTQINLIVVIFSSENLKKNLDTQLNPILVIFKTKNIFWYSDSPYIICLSYTGYRKMLCNFSVQNFSIRFIIICYREKKD